VEAASEIPLAARDSSLEAFANVQELSVGAVGKLNLLFKKIYLATTGARDEGHEWIEPPPQAPAAPAAPPQEMMPLRHVIDQYAHGDFPILDLTTRSKFRQWYRDITGGEPPNGKEPSSLQLGALVHRLDKGFPPYVDFAVFAPFGNRQMKFHRFDAQIWVDNTIKEAKIQGPSDYTSWKAAWDVFQAAMISIKAGSPAMLDAYASGIHRLTIRYPGADNWGFISCADTTLREEVWAAKADRMKELGRWPEHMPWNIVIDATAFGSENTVAGMDHWWIDHVVHPCTHARNGRAYLAELEGTHLQPFPAGLGAGRAAPHQPTNDKRKRGHERGQQQPQGDPNRVRIWDARPKHERHKGGKNKGGKGGHNKGGHGKNGKNKDGSKGGGKPEPRK